MNILIAVITALIFFFGMISMFYLTGLFGKTGQPAKIATKKARKQKNKTKPTSETITRREENFEIDDFISNSQLKDTEVASLLSVLLSKVSNESWVKIIPDESYAKLDSKNSEISELRTNIQDLQEKLSATVQQVESNSEANKNSETCLKERISGFYKQIELLGDERNTRERAYRDREKELKRSLNESIERFRDYSEMKETEQKEVRRLEKQMTEIKVNCGWEDVSKAEEGISLLQKEMCSKNRELVVLNNRIGYLGSLVEEKEVGNAPHVGDGGHHCVDMKERLVIKEAKVVQLTNFVADLKKQLKRFKGQLKEREIEFSSVKELLDELKSDSDCNSGVIRLTANYVEMKNQLSAAYAEIAELESANPQLLC